MGISSRLPGGKDIAPVYAIIVMVVYGWTILKFNYALPGWLYYLNLGEIVGLLAYSLAANLLESLLVLAGLVAAAVVLPRTWFAERFIARGAGLAGLGLAFLIFTANQFTTKEAYPAETVRWAPAVLALIALLVYFLGRVPFLCRAIEWFADRAIIFLYITIPASLLAVILILFRMIL